MNLYFLRHELAGDRTEWAGDDRERPVDQRGEAAYGCLSPNPGRVSSWRGIHSHQSTCPCSSDGRDCRPGIEDERQAGDDERLAPGFDLQALSDIIKDYPKAKAIMLVGHEPDLSETVSALTGGSEIVFKKGGLARVDIDDVFPLRGRLVWLIPPKILSRQSETGRA